MRGSAAAARHAWLAQLVLAMAGTVALDCAPAYAQGAQASLVVTAVVPRRTSMRIAQPATVTVSESDIARGYVDIAAPVEVVVQSNVAEGYTLVFERQGEQVREVQVQGLASDLVLAGSSAAASRPAAGRGFWRDQLMLRFRFALAADAVAGEHRWPVRISLMNQ
jgi:hypothetical protein